MTGVIQQTAARKSPAIILPVDAVYLHIPFCRHKCHYCDFYSVVGAQDDQEPFVEALIAELAHQADQALVAGGPPLTSPTCRPETGLRPRTIFAGGGTPTILAPYLWRNLLAAIQRLGLLERVAEFTVEANPETVSDRLIDVLVAGRVNRISIGAQSFQPALLKMLERQHDPASVARAVATCRRGGIENVNLDLIFAIPGQTLTSLDTDLDAAIKLDPSHLSCYNLTFEPHTPLAERMRRGTVRPLDEDLQCRMYQRVLDRLDEAGFEHYEISAWARRSPRHGPSGKAGRIGGGHEGVPRSHAGPGPTASAFRCLHNMIYWRNGNWLGLGPAAASHMDGTRWKNAAGLQRYIAEAPQPAIVDLERLPAAGRLFDELMLGLRLRDGIAWSWIQAELEAGDPRRSTIDQMIELGLMERHAGRLRLTRRGLFVADSVIGQFL